MADSVCSIMLCLELRVKCNPSRWFVEDNPGEVCPVAGQAAYRDCLRLTRLGDTEAGGFPQYAVNASSFMAFHSILKTSQVSS